MYLLLVGRSERAGSSLPVYVIHWDAPEWCANTVMSLLSSDGVDLDVTVIDNGPNERSVALAGLLPASVRVVRTHSNIGFAGGANVALRDWMSGSYGDSVVVASHDLRLAASSLRELLDVIESHPELGIVGPGLRNFGEPADESDSDRAVEPCTWVSGSCMLMRRACILDVGPFDERFGSYVEDVDYCLRAADAGWGIAHVRGIAMNLTGSRSTQVHFLIERNSLLLDFKRAGSIGVCRHLGRRMLPAIRNVVGAVAPWRLSVDRAHSRRRLSDQCRAVAGAIKEVRRYGSASWRRECSLPNTW